MTYSLTIDGKAVETRDTFDVINPATGDVLAICPQGNVADLDNAVAAAQQAFPAWAATPEPERQEALGKIADATEVMRVVAEEQFGPILPVIRYSNLDDAIAKANALEVGLGASAWGNDPEEAAKVARKLVAGTRWVNRHGVLNPTVPMGGVKQSGIGVEFAEEGLREYTTVQILSMAK